MSAKKYLRTHSTGLNFGSIENQRRELLPGRAQGDEVRLDLLPGERIDIMHAAVEHDRADHVLRSGVEDLAQRPQGDLGDDTLIDLPYLGDWPGHWLDDLAGLDVPERLVLRDDIDRGQVPLDSQQRGFGYISGGALCREPGRVRGAVQHRLDVLADGMPVVLAKAGLHLVDMRIVGVDLALRVGNLPVMRPACLSNLPAPLGFAVPVIGLGLVECPRWLARRQPRNVAGHRTSAGTFAVVQVRSRPTAEAGWQVQAGLVPAAGPQRGGAGRRG